MNADKAAKARHTAESNSSPPQKRDTKSKDAASTAPVEIVPGPYAEPNRRVRFARSLDPRLREWLTRTARAHAHLATIVRRFARPEQAGGASLLGDEYAARIASGDKSVLHDALSYSWGELGAIRDEISAAMDAAPPTRHPPGSPGKIAVLAARLAAGDSLFVRGDADGTLPD